MDRVDNMDIGNLQDDDGGDDEVNMG